MVLTPEDALKTFDEVDIDVLVLQNYIIFKKKRNV
jgi:predicted NodU family carbamoyl transferase